MRTVKFRLAKQFLTASTLLCWLAASCFCSLQLVFGHCDDHASSDHHHDAAQSHASAHKDHHPKHSDPGEKPQEGDTCCKSLQILARANNRPHLSNPEFGTSILPIIYLEIGRLEVVNPDASLSRQPPEPRWLHTHEVYLGIAHQSHAPPLV